MSSRSLFTGTIAACTLLSGGIALGLDINITNNDPSAYHLTNSLGQSLNEGSAMLGIFNSDSWSYNTDTSKWTFEGNSYDQGNLTYSQLADIRNSFHNTLTNIPEEQNGSVTNGFFTLGGQYQAPSSLDTPVYLMVTGADGDLAVFVFKSTTTDDAILNYSDLDPSSPSLFELWLTSKDQVTEQSYYAECILGNVNLENGTVQLLVPEPATATLGLLGLAALMMRRRRQ